MLVTNTPQRPTVLRPTVRGRTQLVRLSKHVASRGPWLLRYVTRQQTLSAPPQQPSGCQRVAHRALPAVPSAAAARSSSPSHRRFATTTPGWVSYPGTAVPEYQGTSQIDKAYSTAVLLLILYRYAQPDRVLLRYRYERGARVGISIIVQ